MRRAAKGDLFEGVSLEVFDRMGPSLVCYAVALDSVFVEIQALRL